MTLSEAIKHCDYVASNCNNEYCMVDHLQLKQWLLELKTFRELYGKFDMSKYITITKSNGDIESISIDKIEKYYKDTGVYDGVEYHTKIRCVDHDYYVRETVEEVTKLIKNKN